MGIFEGFPFNSPGGQPQGDQPPPLPPPPNNSDQKPPPKIPAVGKTDGWPCLCLFLNLFAGAFLFHNAFALISIVLEKRFPITASLRGLSLSVLALLLLCVVVAVSSYRRLPWKTLRPALLATIWTGSAFLPLPGLLSLKNSEFVGTLLNLVIAAWTFASIRRKHGNWLIPETHFAGVQFSLRRTFIGFAVKLFVILPAYIYYLAISCFWMVEWRGKGFIHLRPHGLTTESRVYKLENKFVFLLPTVHVGERDFYEKLLKDVPKENVILLPEGVTDRNHILKSRFSYAVPARAAGLSEQPDFSTRLPIAKRHYDLDVSDFSASTQRSLLAIAELFEAIQSGDSEAALSAYRSLSSVDYDQIQKDLLDARNAKVSFGIRESLETANNVVVPWGAAHMPGIEAQLLKAGFSSSGSRELTAIEWKHVLQRLIEGVSNLQGGFLPNS